MKNYTKGEISKNKIIEIAAKLFWINGYNATGIIDILTRAELPKGSFYYHFKSKKELAICVCDYFEEKLGRWFLSAAEGKSSWKQFIETLTQNIIKESDENEYFGCPFSVIGQETSITESEIANHATEAIKKLGEVFKKVLMNFGIPEENALKLSFQCLAIYEGYLVYFRISWDKKAIFAMKEALIDLYDNNKLK